ncbi:hypothetical protein A8P48_08615 [Yersinia pestis]|nr:hypothetical protein AU253_07050 [Yersinia pestis]PCN66446.1 hypothetical protein A8P48_08615 [Yersinia pestis]
MRHSLYICSAKNGTRYFYVAKCDLAEQKSKLFLAAYYFAINTLIRAFYLLKYSVNANILHNYAI